MCGTEAYVNAWNYKNNENLLYIAKVNDKNRFIFLFHMEKKMVTFISNDYKFWKMLEFLSDLI